MKMGWSLVDMPSQQGRTVLITGANDGLGLLLTRAFAARQAERILMACRDLAKAEAARAAVLADHPAATLEVVPLDLGSLASVRTCAERVLASSERLDLLIANAGIMAVPFGTTEDGLERHMGVNYFGHYALVARLLPLLGCTDGARLVTTTSLAERFGRATFQHPVDPRHYQRWRAYCNSKLAIRMLAMMVEAGFRRHGIAARALSAHPGFARTNLRKTRLETERDPWLRLQLQLYELISGPADKAVLPLLYAATAPEAQGGQYIGLSGVFELQGEPKPTRGNRLATDPAALERLERQSEALTGLRLEYSAPTGGLGQPDAVG
jgi:NAD(P)-dependent dehydrogenase (short-subunit alcohol dehydrogenase family)